jgi:hypothetical protein
MVNFVDCWTWPPGGASTSNLELEPAIFKTTWHLYSKKVSRRVGGPELTDWLELKHPLLPFVVSRSDLSFCDTKSISSTRALEALLVVRGNLACSLRSSSAAVQSPLTPGILPYSVRASTASSRLNFKEYTRDMTPAARSSAKSAWFSTLCEHRQRWISASRGSQGLNLK